METECAHKKNYVKDLQCFYERLFPLKTLNKHKAKCLVTLPKHNSFSIPERTILYKDYFCGFFNK